jgi:beta-lactam-binding protein with PASTA domain
MSLIQKISQNIIARNLVLAFCGVVVFAAVTGLLLNLVTRHGQSRPVPDFIGVHIDDVKAMARREGLRIEVVDSLFAAEYGGGAVIEQLPRSGTEVKRGRRVFVTITSYEQKMVKVPYVTGYSLRQAINLIEMAGLEIKELRYTPNIAPGNVLAELVGRDTVRQTSDMSLPSGGGVTLVVGEAQGADWTAIPKVVGLSLGEARSRLWERGFNVGNVGRDNGINLINQKDAVVHRQSPAYGRVAAPGTSVAIDLTLDQTKIADGLNAADREARRVIQAREAELEAARATAADSLPL